jgi:hypothetical protein
MIGVLIDAHAALAESLASAVSHVLGTRPAQFAAFPVAPDDDPAVLLPKARAAGKGSKITLEIAGPDEEAAMEAICALVADRFGEAS